MAVEVGDDYLVARAQEGYLDAFEQLVQRHSLAAYRVASWLLADDHEAQDVVQDALFLAWRKLAQFRGQTSFVMWLYALVTRTALERLSHERRQGDTLPLASKPAVEVAGDAVGGGSRAAVRAALAALTPTERVAFVLHYFEGLRHEDVATIMGSTAPVIRDRLNRARRTMSTVLVGWVTIS